jgi:hypothetical protein
MVPKNKSGNIRQAVYLLEELKEHIPYSVLSSVFALVVVGLLTAVCSLIDIDRFPKAAKSMFHLFHPAHMLLSATATTAMFWKHERRLFKAILIGFFGAVLLCGVSDIIIPFLGGRLLGASLELHICILEDPLLVMPFLFIGIFTGIVAAESIPRATFFSHTAHVFVSSIASVLYLVAFGFVNWITLTGAVFVLVFLAVVIPCCLSDIVFPLLLVKRSKQEFKSQT